MNGGAGILHAGKPQLGSVQLRDPGRYGKAKAGAMLGPCPGLVHHVKSPSKGGQGEISVTFSPPRSGAALAAVEGAYLPPDLR